MLSLRLVTATVIVVSAVGSPSETVPRRLPVAAHRQHQRIAQGLAGNVPQRRLLLLDRAVP
jgi:hypothetical protein